jgi:hypothetical protein
MNAHSQIEARLAEDVGAALENAEPADEVEALTEFHRRRLDRYERRVSATRKGLKATIASLEQDKKFAKQRYEEAMRTFADRIADTKAQAERDIAADRKLVAASRVSLGGE